MPFNKSHHNVFNNATMTDRVETLIINHVHPSERRKTLSPIRNTPPSTSQNFTGQSEYIHILHNHFNNSRNSARKMLLLHGMGGIGKTQICLKYKDEVSDRYQHIFWIDATSNDTIEQGLKDIFKIHAPDMPHRMSYSSAVVLQWISVQASEWLFIYDNADGSPDIVGKYLPPGNKGNILISSRNPEHKRLVSPINSKEVEVMSEEVAVELLLKASGLHGNSAKHYAIAAEICSKLHYLPLAIDQAGSYINSRKCKIENYASIYEKYRVKLMTNKNFKGASMYDKTVYGTWEISYRKILGMSENSDEDLAEAAKYAIKLINICAFLYHEDISDDIFERAAVYYQDHVDAYRNHILPTFIPTMDKTLLNVDEFNQWDPMRYGEAVGILASFSLIKRTADDAVFGFHPLVQTWCQDRLPPEERRMWILNTRGLLCCSTARGYDMTTELTYKNTVFIHAIQNLSHDSANDSDMKYYHDLLIPLRRIMHINGKYDLEHMLASKIYHMCKKEYGEQNAHTFASMGDLALTCRNLGKFDEAWSLQNQLLHHQSEILGEVHPDTLTTMSYLAGTYRSLGKYAEAERLETQVLEMRTTIEGKEHADTLASMACLARTYVGLGKLTDAEELQVQVLDMRARILGTEHPDTLISMGNLAATYYKKAKYKEAEELQTEALEMSIKVQGKHHPDTVSCRENLAHTYRKLGKYKGAQLLVDEMELESSMKVQ